MKFDSKLTIATATLAILIATALYAQDKYSLKSPKRNRLLRLQGIRRLVGGLFRSHHRSAQGDRRQSHHDQRVQGRHSRQRPAFSGWLHDREASVETEEEHRGPLRRRCAGRLYAGFRHRERTARDFREAVGGDTPCSTTEAASDKFTADLQSPSDCGHACHSAVKAKDYIFHPYQKR